MNLKGFLVQYFKFDFFLILTFYSFFHQNRTKSESETKFVMVTEKANESIQRISVLQNENENFQRFFHIMQFEFLN